MPVCALRKLQMPNWTSVTSINMKRKLNSLAEINKRTTAPQLCDTIRDVREIEVRIAHTAYIFPKRAGHSGKSSMLRDRETLRRKMPFFLASWSAKRLKRK